MRTVFVMGEAASGKTQLVRYMLANLGPAGEPIVEGEAQATPYPMLGILVLGIYNNHPFAGTDRLALHTQPQMLRLLQKFQASKLNQDDDWIVLLEGDRYATPSFCEAVSKLGPLTIVMLEVPEHILTFRRNARGSHQSEIWLKGRKTKLRRLSERFAPIHVPNGDPAAQLFVRHVLEHLLHMCTCEELPDGRRWAPGRWVKEA